MTNRLYFDNAYLTEWETRVVKTIQKEDGWYVLLEETAFYPEGGGQPCDTGTIGGIAVLDVISEDEEVWHKVERPIEAATKAVCRIDWQRRFDHMQQHSGQHLLSAICLKLFEVKTLSFHMGTDASTIDVEMPEMTADQLAQLEWEVNQAVYSSHRIESYLVSAEEAERLPLVKPPKVTGHVRIVEIESVEYNACGGTHVSATGGIGMIKLLKAEKTKGHTRIAFLCGNRALTEFNESMGILSKLSRKWNARKEDIIDRLEKFELEQTQLQAELSALKQERDALVARVLVKSSRNNRLVAHVFEDKPLKDLQNLAQQVASMCDFPVLLVDQAGSKVVLAYSGSAGLSCGAFFKEHLGKFRGKGGGSGVMAQAGFERIEDALAFFDFARSAVRG